MATTFTFGPVPKTRLAPARQGRTVDVQQGDDLERILAAARTGDDAAVGELYRMYSPAIYRYLSRRMNDPESARDLTSAVFIRVIEAIRAHNAWRDSFTGWLFRIAHNLMVDYLRAESRHPLLELTPNIPCPRGAAMEDDVVRANSFGDVRAAMHELRPAYANVLHMRFGEGLTHAEVGDRLGKSSDTVKVTQFRALRALRRELDEPKKRRTKSRRCSA